mmetsp:Transcript_69319/g.122725  ORF Transcript_69319/g.122725 Transcript_69319/m.122725 type:complete len:229 (-) Transcript_69319:429-1115(-)
MHVLQVLHPLDDLLEHFLQTRVTLVPAHRSILDVHGIKHGLLSLLQPTGGDCSCEKLFDGHLNDTNLALLEFFVLQGSVQLLLQLCTLGLVMLEIHLTNMQLTADHQVLILKLCLHAQTFVPDSIQAYTEVIVGLNQFLTSSFQGSIAINQHLYVTVELFLGLLHHLFQEGFVMLGLGDLGRLCVFALLLLPELLVQGINLCIVALALHLLVLHLFLAFLDCGLELLE